MTLVLRELITPAHAAALCATLAAARFADGRRSAGPSVRARKHNLELESGQVAAGPLVAALKSHPELLRWALPRRSAPLLFNRYDPGMTYGDHVDNALGVVDGEFVRTDLSVTVFLSAPADYDGGELVIDSDRAANARSFKLPAGHAVVYQAGAVHRVEPVTRGTRFAAVTWIESLVRSAARRRVLYDLAVATDGLDGADRVQVEKCRTNLLRLWVET